MVRFSSILLSFFLVLLSGCGTGSSVKNTDNAQTGIGQNVKEAKQTKVAELGSSTRSISLDDLLGNSSPNSGPKVVSNSGPWKYYTGPDGTKRQDISGVEWTVLEGGKGKTLTQEMVSQKLRRYVIKGTFDLGGKTIKMPYGSVLDLESGDLRNGSLVFDDTRVTPVYAISKQTKLSKIKVSGTYYETLVDLWGASDEPVFPWDTTAPKKVYTVDLKRFGITAGYQKKGSNGHYSDKQYDLMYNNGVGFTNAIQWAYKNGYDGVRFPKNDYCFTPRTVGPQNSPKCAQVLVLNLDKFDINLGGGTYYNILDSSQKSKYYKSDGEQYDQSSYMFWVACCINLSIHNGSLVGDRLIRDYSNPKEVNQEQTYGIVIQAYSYNVRIHHIDASSFMGDGIAMWQIGEYFDSYDSHMKTPAGHWCSFTYPGRYTTKERVIKDDYSCTISDFFTISREASNPIISKVKAINVFSINNNRGYTRIPNVYQNVEVLTFNDNNTSDVPSRIIKTSYLSSFRLLLNEKRYKVQFYYDEGVGSKGFMHNVTVSDVVPGNCVIEDCIIRDNHRGGITGGINHTVIRNSLFSKDLMSKNYRKMIVPIYTAGATNYHIDYEDSFGKDLSIYGCIFKSPRELTGRLLFGVLTLDFHDNVSDNPVIIYNNLFSNIYNNTFNNKTIGISRWLLTNYLPNQRDYGCKYLTRLIHIHNNTINKSIEANNDYRTFVLSHDNTKK